MWNKILLLHSPILEKSYNHRKMGGKIYNHNLPYLWSKPYNFTLSLCISENKCSLHWNSYKLFYIQSLINYLSLIFFLDLTIWFGSGLTSLIALIYISVEPAVTQNCVPLLQAFLVTKDKENVLLLCFNNFRMPCI